MQPSQSFANGWRFVFSGGGIWGIYSKSPNIFLGCHFVIFVRGGNKFGFGIYFLLFLELATRSGYFRYPYVLIFSHFFVSRRLIFEEINRLVTVYSFTFHFAGYSLMLALLKG